MQCKLLQNELKSTKSTSGIRQKIMESSLGQGPHHATAIALVFEGLVCTESVPSSFSVAATTCHGVRRYHEDTPDGVYLFLLFAFKTDTFTSYVFLGYVYLSLFDAYVFTLEHVTTVYWIRRKGNSV